MSRTRLPDRRFSETFSVDCAGLSYHATASWLSNGRLGEIFITANKCASAADTAVRDAAIAASLAFQHGADPDTLRRTLCRNSQGNASGPLAAALDIVAVQQ
jgi:hypothetical protein